MPMPEEQLVGIQRTYYVDAVDERSADKISLRFMSVSREPQSRCESIGKLYMYDGKGNAIARLQDLGKELWEVVKVPLTRCSDDEVEMYLSSVQEGVLEYNRKVPKDVEEFDSKADSCKVWLGGRWIVLRKPSRATSDIGEGPLNVDATFEGMHSLVVS